MANRKYTKDLLQSLVCSSVSINDVARKIGMKISGGTCGLLKRRIVEYGIDVSHFTGKGSNRGLEHKGGEKRLTFSDILIVRPIGSVREQAYRLRRALIESGRPYRCEAVGCSISDKWLDKEIRLHVDHINGNYLDCRGENLRFLCPNCHSQTIGYSNNKGLTDVTSTVLQCKAYRARGRMAKLENAHR